MRKPGDNSDGKQPGLGLGAKDADNIWGYCRITGEDGGIVARQRDDRGVGDAGEKGEIALGVHRLADGPLFLLIGAQIALVTGQHIVRSSVEQVHHGGTRGVPAHPGTSPVHRRRASVRDR